MTDARRYRSKASGRVYEVVVQSRSLTGSVTLRDPTDGVAIRTTNDRLREDYEFFRVGEPERIPLAVPPDQQAFFDAHMEAMDLALRAEEAIHEGRHLVACGLYHEAVVKEYEAIARVPADRDRTREILNRSVLSLALKAADAARESVR